MNASCQNKFGCCCVRYIAMSIIFPVRNNVKRKCVKSRLASAKRHMNARNAGYQGNSKGMGAHALSLLPTSTPQFLPIRIGGIKRCATTLACPATLSSFKCAPNYTPQEINSWLPHCKVYSCITGKVTAFSYSVTQSNVRRSKHFY